MAQKLITFHYTLTDADDTVIESSQGRDPISFIEGFGMIVPGLEKEVIHFAEGDKKRVEVKAEEAYGLIDFSKYVQVPKESLPKDDIQVGDVFRSNNSPFPFTVKQVHETHVVLDANHPLAGEDLIFDVEIMESREATDEEMQGLREQIEAMQRQVAEGAEGADGGPQGPENPEGGPNTAQA